MLWRNQKCSRNDGLIQQVEQVQEAVKLNTDWLIIGTDDLIVDLAEQTKQTCETAKRRKVRRAEWAKAAGTCPSDSISIVSVLSELPAKQQWQQ